MNIYIRLLTITLSLICVTQIIHAQDGEVTQITSQKKALGLELGARLPELVVTDQLGKEVPLAAAKGDRWVYVFFYPMALTSG